ncbi:MAG: ACT domain-containing protein [Desulfovibrionaceae bacterium]|nr:ACT domain-containing protein [Desulfovibrionaceae bacterium]
MTVNQISVFIENAPGSMAALTRLMRENSLNIRALCIAEVNNFGILRMIVDDVYATSTVLKAAGYVFKITPVLAVPLKDEAGSLCDVLDALGDSGINVEYIYAFTTSRKDKAFVVLRVEDNEGAARVLAENHCTPVSQSELA